MTQPDKFNELVEITNETFSKIEQKNLIKENKANQKMSEKAVTNKKKQKLLSPENDFFPQR